MDPSTAVGLAQVSGALCDTKLRDDSQKFFADQGAARDGAHSAEREGAGERVHRVAHDADAESGGVFGQGSE